MSISEKLITIAENEPKIYDKGVSDERVKFTNAITDNGTRKNYMYAFAYANYSGVRFAEPITPDYYINHMFYSCANLTELPTPLDFSKILETATDSYAYRRSVFAYCRNLEFVPDLNMRVIGGIEEWFIQCRKLHTIELLRVKRETIYNSTFSMCDSLENITFEGEIGQNISFADCPKLSTASIVNIFEHLSDSQSATLIIKTTAKENMSFPYTSPQTNITYNSWDELVATKSAWTISLA